MLKRIHIADAINWGHSLNRGLVSRWQSLPGQQRGNIFRDLCKKYHGTLTNGPTWTGPLGRPGGFGSLSLDGTDDAISILGTAIASSGAISVWWMPTETFAGSDHPIIRAAGPSSQLFDLYPFSDNQVYAGWFQTGNDDRRIVAKPSVTTGTWHHWCLTWANGGATSLFFDGAALSSGGTLNATWDTTTATTFRLSAAGTAFARCNLDDARVFNRALSAAEIYAIYEGSRQPYDPTLNHRKRTRVFDMGGGGGGGFQPAWAYNSTIVTGYTGIGA